MSKIENIVYNTQFSTFQHFTQFIKPGSRFLKLQNMNKIIFKNIYKLFIIWVTIIT